MDNSNLSIGVTGQYALKVNGFNVAPQASLRFTRVDMDDYTVKGSGDIAHYSADSANIFSIPVGVTFSKDIVAGSWTVKPALDLTLTANMGDDSIDGSVDWTGVANLNTQLESEIVWQPYLWSSLGEEEVVVAKTGNFKLDLGVTTLACVSRVHLALATSW